jgi:hypothetical protein
LHHEKGKKLEKKEGIDNFRIREKKVLFRGPKIFPDS